MLSYNLYIHIRMRDYRSGAEPGPGHQPASGAGEGVPGGGLALPSPAGELLSRAPEWVAVALLTGGTHLVQAGHR